MPLDVRPIPPEQHRAFVEERSASFLQTPAWGEVKSGWQHLDLGWFDGDQLVGAGLALLRRTPVVERYLAYLPEGPVVDWATYDARDVLEPLVAALHTHKAFAVKIGPQVVTRRWSTPTLKAALDAHEADGGLRLGDVDPDTTDPAGVALAERLRELGWLQKADAGAGFGDVQPRYVFQLPLADAARKTSSRASTSCGGATSARRRPPGSRSPWAASTTCPPSTRSTSESPPRATASPRADCPYFQRMWRVLTAEDPDRIRLYLARHEGEVLAATTAVRVGRHVWYSYGASTDRRARPAAEQRDPVADDPRRPRRRRRDLRHARHHRHPRPRRPPVRAAPLQARAPAARPWSTWASGTTRSARWSTAPSRPT